MFNKPHRRYNPLTDQWVLVSPQRTQRPWQGQEESLALADRPGYDPDCYLCPGNLRKNGKRNPDYRDIWVFDNDFPALLSDTTAKKMNRAGLLKAASEKGLCRVMCFSPRHDLCLPQMTLSAIEKVIAEWVHQYQELGKLDWIRHVQIFENKGALMGASNPHPHCQIWASESIPAEPAKELAACSQYLHTKSSCLLCDYLHMEQQQGERVVMANDSFVIVVPFWAIWPFETLLIPRRHISDLAQLRPDERRDLADILKRLTIRYDNLFQTSFPYSMGWHQSPTDGRKYPQLHLHAHFYPPLLRSASVRKFMVGYEMLGEPQRDITAEEAARRLRELLEVHYLPEPEKGCPGDEHT
jgi:UDPglucose--hexose-1-phosphate uridylyltransferase